MIEEHLENHLHEGEEEHMHTHVLEDGTTVMHSHGEHGHHHSHAQTKAVLNRLSRAIGHLESIKRMVEDGRDCSEVLIQLSAVKSAINNTGKIILQDHIVYCGPYPLFVENIDQAKEALAAFMAENDKEPRLILVQGVGAFIMEDDKGKAAKAQLLAKDAIKLAVYAESFGGPLQMTDEITYFITHWEAEAYRSKK